VSHKVLVVLETKEGNGGRVTSPCPHACLHLWTVATSLYELARFQEPWRRSLLLKVQQSAILSNSFGSQPSPYSTAASREPSTREGERLQIRSNSDLINPILVAAVLGRESEWEASEGADKPHSSPERSRKPSTVWIQPTRPLAQLSSPPGEKRQKRAQGMFPLYQLHHRKDGMVFSFIFSLFLRSRSLSLMTDAAFPRPDDQPFAHGKRIVASHFPFTAFSHW